MRLRNASKYFTTLSNNLKGFLKAFGHSANNNALHCAGTVKAVEFLCQRIVCFYLLFLSGGHRLSVDDTEDGEDNDKKEKLPANELIQRSLEQRR